MAIGGLEEEEEWGREAPRGSDEVVRRGRRRRRLLLPREAEARGRRRGGRRGDDPIGVVLVAEGQAVGEGRRPAAVGKRGGPRGHWRRRHARRRGRRRRRRRSARCSGRGPFDGPEDVPLADSVVREQLRARGIAEEDGARGDSTDGRDVDGLRLVERPLEEQQRRRLARTSRVLWLEDDAAMQWPEGARLAGEGDGVDGTVLRIHTDAIRLEHGEARRVGLLESACRSSQGR